MKNYFRRGMLAVTTALLAGACGERITIGVFEPLPASTSTSAGQTDAAPFPGVDGSLGADGSADFPLFRDAGSAPGFGCVGKACGTLCSPCAADASACNAPLVFHTCSEDGTCQPDPVSCAVIHITELDGGEGGVAACAGKTCGASCTCQPADGTCLDDGGVCGADGLCARVPTRCL